MAGDKNQINAEITLITTKFMAAMKEVEKRHSGFTKKVETEQKRLNRASLKTTKGFVKMHRQMDRMRTRHI